MLLPRLELSVFYEFGRFVWSTRNKQKAEGCEADKVCRSVLIWSALVTRVFRRSSLVQFVVP